METMCDTQTLTDFFTMAQAETTGIVIDFETPIFKTEYVTYAASNTVKAFAEKRSKWKKFINKVDQTASYCAG